MVVEVKVLLRCGMLWRRRLLEFVLWGGSHRRRTHHL